MLHEYTLFFYLDKKENQNERNRVRVEARELTVLGYISHFILKLQNFLEGSVPAQLDTY